MIEGQPSPELRTIEDDAKAWLNDELSARIYFSRWGEEAIPEARREARRWQEQKHRRPSTSPVVGVDSNLWISGEMDSDEYFGWVNIKQGILAEAYVRQAVKKK